jgi:hypothetical protein
VKKVLLWLLGVVTGAAGAIAGIYLLVRREDKRLSAADDE